MTSESAPTIFGNRFTRRRFMQYSAVGAGVVAVSPYMSKLQAFAAPPVADNQGILITIQLAGGNDGLNMVIPTGDAHYRSLRPTIGITNALPVATGMGFHPSLVKLQARYKRGAVAVVRGVGYQPPDLSHFTSTDIWMHGWGGSSIPTTGWVGRWLDTLPNTDHEALYGVSLHGSVNPHLAGNLARPSSLPLHISDAFGIDRSDPSDARMFDAFKGFGNGASGLGPLGDLYDETAQELMLLTQRIRPAYGFADQPTDIEEQLVLAAHLINANLGIRVIDTTLDGFDTHSDQATWHATLMSRLDNAIESFWKTLSARWHGQVVMMTFSEFGRRPEENGDAGTDHGTAAPLFVIGDHVKGGMFGTQPSLTDLDTNGNLKPHVDFRQVYAAMLHTWLGANDKAILGATFAPLTLFAAPPSAPPKPKPATSTQAYWIAGPSGHVHGLGSATKFSSVAHVSQAIVAGACTKTHKGLWLAGRDGHVYSFGDATNQGSASGLTHPVVGMAATPTGKGYWLVTSNGQVVCKGDAKNHGSPTRLNKPIVAMAATPSGKGYWLCASDGGIFGYGDAKFYGSTGNIRLNKPIVTFTATPTGKGYWFCASDGGIFGYGDAKFHGAMTHSNSPVCGMVRTPTGNGYWVAAADGTVGAYGDASVFSKIHDGTSVIVA